jgi:hypothetical protein
VGSPDVYAEGQAGPYHLSVVVRPPLVIPGVADIEVQARGSEVDRITMTPIPLTGEAAKYPPVPDAMERPSKDGEFYTGHLWIMATGSWQIRFAVSGAAGQGILSIPLPAAAMATRRMESGMGAMLAGLGLLLVLGLVGIIGAATREAKLAPGTTATRANRRNSYVAMGVALSFLIAGVILGNVWWKSEAESYSKNVYKPLEMTAEVAQGNRMILKLRDPGWLQQRKLDDFVLDHNHLMHLYMIRWPEMDTVFHLHPEPVTTGEFQLTLPLIPAGTYRLYADVVHAMGFPETVVGTISLPSIAGRPLSGDDAEGTAPPVRYGEPNLWQTAGNSAVSNAGEEQRFHLGDVYTMRWSKPTYLQARVPIDFHFELVDPYGNPPRDMSLYMGMAGHAAFVKTDGSVFAHVHPNGTVAMAALMMANPQPPMTGNDNGAGASMNSMPGMELGASAPPAFVDFPYGFPSIGSYRIFVQMKHGGVVETGVFDVTVR